MPAAVADTMDAAAAASAPASDVVTTEGVVDGTPRKEGWPPRRSPESIREVLMKSVDGSIPSGVHDYLLGPHDSEDAFRDTFNTWARDSSAQPKGTFSFRKTTRRPETRYKGRQRKIECMTKNCTCEVIGERAEDGKYYVNRLNMEHIDGCLRGSQETAAERRARGQLWIPADFMEDAKGLKMAGFSTTDINKYLLWRVEQQDDADAHITWNWKHLDHKLSGVLGEISKDARGVVEWLTERKTMHGLASDVATDTSGCLERVFFEVEGAREHWDRGNKVLLYDTTHGTNQYEMKLGCFVGKDCDGRTILLGVSLLKNEDGQSFKWAFDAFFKAMGSEPTCVFTDGDHAMGAALRTFPSVKHFLCIWHLRQNLETHAERLFPQRKNKAAKERFIKMFEHLLYDVGTVDVKDLESVEKQFETDWADMLRVVNEVTRCPADLELGVNSEEDVYFSCEEEMDAEDDDAAAIAADKRKKGRRRKPATWLAWQWLKHQHAIRHKWARVFVMRHTTFSIFSTQRSESWHASLKAWQKIQKRLLQMFIMIERRRTEMTDRFAETSARLRQQHMDRRHLHPAIINDLKGKFTPYAVEQMRKNHVLSNPLEAHVKDNDETDVATGTTRFFVGTPGDVCPAIASLHDCSRGCLQNSGLVCPHMFAVYARSATYQVADYVIHPFWSLKEGEVEEEEEEEEEGDGKKIITQDLGEVRGGEDEGEGTLFSRVFASIAKVGEKRAATREGEHDVGGPSTSIPPKGARYGAIMGSSKSLASLGQSNKEAYLMLMQGIDKLYEEVYAKVKRPPTGEGSREVPSTVGVRNPSTVKKGGGRTATKRKTSKHTAG